MIALVPTHVSQLKSNTDCTTAYVAIRISELFFGTDSTFEIASKARLRRFGDQALFRAAFPTLCQPQTPQHPLGCVHLLFRCNFTNSERQRLPGRLPPGPGYLPPGPGRPPFYSDANEWTPVSKGKAWSLSVARESQHAH
jgi:hypothetical protein